MVEYKPKWYRHDCTIKEKHPPIICFKWSQESKRKRGRPRMIWESSIRETMEIYKLNDVITLGTEKWEGFLRTIYMG